RTLSLPSFPTRRSSDLVSIFVDPDLEQIRQCQKIRAPKIEINTGKFTEGWIRSTWTTELEKINTAAKAARKMGLIVLAGHGLNRSEEHTSELQSPDHLV